MVAIRSVKQRMVLRKRPRALPLGTVRQWQDGSYVKVGRGKWKRSGQSTAPTTGGLPGLIHDLTRQGKKVNWKQTTRIARQVLNQMSTWDVRHPPVLLELPSATAALLSTVKGDSLPWWLYCARRSAEFNAGLVDLGTLDRHVERAQRYHEGRLPEVLLHKAVAGAYRGPMTVSDINMASWDQFFAEGGSLNQPAWLESNRLKDLRHQFELLARLHGG